MGPKYSLAEIERRWLVDLAALGSLEGEPYFEIEDLYIDGTQLRLRRIEGAGSPAAFKLCKKYGKAGALSEPITNLYLSEMEYRVLVDQLGGNALRKRRYMVAGGALDVYPDNSLAPMFEIEFQSEAEAERYAPPPFVRQEVTGNEAFFGAAIAESWQSQVAVCEWRICEKAPPIAFTQPPRRDEFELGRFRRQ